MVLTGFLYRRISSDGAGPNFWTQRRMVRSTQPQVIADGQQDDVPREAMAGHQARRLARRVSATGTTDTNGAATLIVTIASQVPR
jgi:hypothetical protein